MNELLSKKQPFIATKVNNYIDFKNTYGIDIADKNLNRINPARFYSLFYACVSRMYPEQYWKDKFLHHLGYEEKSRKVYERMVKFNGEDYSDKSLLVMLSSITNYSLNGLMFRMNKCVKENKPIRRKTNMFITTCKYPIIAYDDSYLTDKLGIPIKKYMENEYATIKTVHSIMVEIDFHDLTGITKEERNELERRKQHVYETMKNCKLPGTLEMFSARGYYIVYTPDIPFTADEANDVTKAIIFYLNKELNLLCDTQAININRLRRLPLMYQQGLYFKYIVKPVRALNNYYSNFELVNFLRSYIYNNLKKYNVFCKEHRMNAKFYEWEDLNKGLLQDNINRRYKTVTSDARKSIRSINLDKMRDNPLDMYYTSNTLLPEVRHQNIDLLRFELDIRDHSFEGKLSRYQIVKTFIKEYGHKLSKLLNISWYERKLLSSPLYVDRNPSCILNSNQDKEYIYHFSNYPSGDIIDFIEYALGYYEEHSNEESFNYTINFLARLMNVEVEPYKQIDEIDISVYRETYRKYVNRINKKFNLRETAFKKVALKVLDVMCYNYMNHGSGYNTKTLLTNEFMASQLKGISKATISRYINLLVATGIVSRFWDIKKKANRNIVTVLMFNKFENVDSNMDRIAKFIGYGNSNISRWDIKTYSQIFDRNELVKIYGSIKVNELNKTDNVWSSILEKPANRSFSHTIDNRFKKTGVTNLSSFTLTESNKKGILEFNMPTKFDKLFERIELEKQETIKKCESLEYNDNFILDNSSLNINYTKPIYVYNIYHSNENLLFSSSIWNYYKDNVTISSIPSDYSDNYVIGYYKSSYSTYSHYNIMKKLIIYEDILICQNNKLEFYEGIYNDFKTNEVIKLLK